MPSNRKFLVPDFGAGRTILVVDDNSFLRYLAARVLEEFGFRVMTAKDGNEGLDLFRKFADKIVLVLLDRPMEGWDGRATLGDLLSIRPDARIVLSSGLDAPASAAVCMQQVAGFLRKPYTPSILVETVYEVLHQRQAHSHIG